MSVQLPDAQELDRLESPDPTERFRVATHLAERLEAVARQLQQVRAGAAAELSANGRSYRDIGEIFGISPQRVGQLIGQVEGVAELVKAWAELERKLRMIAAKTGLGHSASTRQLVESLREHRLIDDDVATELVEIWTSRSTGVHRGQFPPGTDAEQLLDDAIVCSARLEAVLESAGPTSAEPMSEERKTAEQLMARVRKEHSDTNWVPGRCDECGRAIPVPSGNDLWVCSQRCLESWRMKLYRFVDPGSEEEAITRAPEVVPYWI